MSRSWLYPCVHGHIRVCLECEAEAENKEMKSNALTFDPKMTQILPTAGKHCIRCGEIHFVAHDILCTICRPIVDYEARSAFAAISTSAEPGIKTFPTPEEGGPEFKFARAAADRFRNLTIVQAQKGFLKYNKELDPNMKYDWLAMAEEEAADLWQYIQCERERRKEEAKYVDELEQRVKELEKDCERWYRFYNQEVKMSAHLFLGIRDLLVMYLNGHSIPIRESDGFELRMRRLLDEYTQWHSDVPGQSENTVAGQMEGNANESE